MPQRQRVIVPPKDLEAQAWSEHDSPPVTMVDMEYVDGWVEEPPSEVVGLWGIESEEELLPEYVPVYGRGPFSRLERLKPLRRFKTTYKRTIATCWVDSIKGPMGETRTERRTEVA